MITEPIGQTVRCQGGETWVVQAGDGPDLLLLSGLGDTHEVWRAPLPLLAARHRVTVLDNRGIGRSPRGAGELSMRRFAEDAGGVLDALGISRADVVGSSMGGAIAQELALAEPDRVATLTLVGTWGWPDALFSSVVRYFCRLFRVEDDPRRTAEAVALWVYSGRSFNDGTAERLIDAAMKATGPWQTLDVFDETAEAAIRHDVGDRLNALTVPTLVVVGSEDRICRPELSRLLARSIPNASLRVLNDRGHEPFHEAPDEFVGLLEEFWEMFTRCEP